MYCVVYERYSCLGKCNIRIFRSGAISYQVWYSVCLSSLWTIHLIKLHSFGMQLLCISWGLTDLSVQPHSHILAPAPVAAARSYCDVLHLLWAATLCSVLFPGTCDPQPQFSVRWNTCEVCKCFSDVFRPAWNESGSTRPVIILLLFYWHRNI